MERFSSIPHSAFRTLHSAVAILCALAAAYGAEAPKFKAPAEETREVKVPIYNPDSGELEWQLLAAKVSASPEDPRVLLGTNVKIIGYRKGVAQTVEARRGRVNTETRAAQLEGDVVMELHGDAPARIEADDMEWDHQNGTACTRGPVKLTRADAIVTGQGARLWLSAARGEDGEREKTAQAVIERRARTELIPGADAAFLQASAVKSTEPIVITCDGPLTISRAELRATFRENVRATQAKLNLTCDTLDIVARPVPNEKGKVDIESAVASGNVRVDDAQTVALADRAEWRRDEGSTRLAGRPAEIRWDNGNRLAGGLILRSGDGAEIVVTSTPEHPQNVYLLSPTILGAADGGEKLLPHQLRPSDISDWPAFCTALSTAQAQSPAARLLAMLPEELRSAIRSAAQGSTLGSQRKARITNALNSMLASREFYREADFRGVTLPPEAAELLKAGTQGLDDAGVRKLNRLLLEAAFPGHVAKAQEKKPAPK